MPFQIFGKAHDKRRAITVLSLISSPTELGRKHVRSKPPFYSPRTMIPSSVNKTNLHPGRVVYALLLVFLLAAMLNLAYRPSREHTKIEEELYEIAHIDYERVTIVSLSTNSYWQSSSAHICSLDCQPFCCIVLQRCIDL